MSTITFRAALGGDGESFQFVDVPEEDMRAILGNEQYEANLKVEQDIAAACQEDDPDFVPTETNDLYPDELLAALGCEDGKRYRFTVTAEELP